MIFSASLSFLIKLQANSHENTCVRVSFLITLQALGTGVFLWILRIFLRTPFLTEHLRGTFSQYSMGETVFYSFHYSNGCLAASDLFHNVYTIKFYPLSFLKNVIHQIDNKNKWLLHPASFTVKFGLVFVLTLGNAFC